MGNFARPHSSLPAMGFPPKPIITHHITSQNFPCLLASSPNFSHFWWPELSNISNSTPFVFLVPPISCLFPLAAQSFYVSTSAGPGSLGPGSRIMFLPLQNHPHFYCNHTAAHVLLQTDIVHYQPQSETVQMPLSEPKLAPRYLSKPNNLRSTSRLPVLNLKVRRLEGPSHALPSKIVHIFYSRALRRTITEKKTICAFSYR